MLRAKSVNSAVAVGTSSSSTMKAIVQGPIVMAVTIPAVSIGATAGSNRSDLWAAKKRIAHVRKNESSVSQSGMMTTPAAVVVPVKNHSHKTHQAPVRKGEKYILPPSNPLPL